MSDDDRKAGEKDTPEFATGGLIEHDLGPHDDEVPAPLDSGYFLPLDDHGEAEDEAPLPPPHMGEAFHHEGSTCAFCGKADACGHPQLKGPAVCTAAPWVPNVFVKSCG